MKHIIRCLGVYLAMLVGAEAIAGPELINYPQYPAIDYGTGEEADVARKGEYLAKAGDCLACHTDTKSDPWTVGPAFAGGLPIATPFGTFYTPNITFDEETGIGTWTEDDFKSSMHDGSRPSGGFAAPVFPYIYFSKVTDEDIHALYVYLKKVPKVHQENKALPIPFGIPGARYAFFGWNLLFFYPTEGPFEYDASQSEQWNRGAYLVQGLGHCGMCHTPLTPFGSPQTDYYLTGGFIDGYWAPNITKLGLTSATVEEIADVFSKNELINNAGPVQGPMAEVNHDSLKYLTREDQIAMAVYLKTVESKEPFAVVERAKGQTNFERGQQVYRATCIHCHQKGEVGAPLLGSAGNWYLRLQERGLDKLYVHAIDGFNSMPPKGACVTCSDRDVKDAVDYLLNESLKRAQWYDLRLNKTTKTEKGLNGQQVYTQHCATCHDSGTNGAPTIGDKTAWAPIINGDLDSLMADTIDGQKHPKNGGCEQCSTQEVITALKYMVNQSKEEGNYSLW